MLKNLYLTVKKETFEKKWLVYILFFITAFYFFYFLHTMPKFTDPDSFYHTKIAVLMRDQGIIKSFPYLPYTILNENFADHHLLYHIALVPFVMFLPPLYGVKFATLIFASLTIVVFYWFLKKIGVRGAWFFTAILMVDSSFVFRINLAKAQALAISMFFIVYYLIVKKKLLHIFFFSFFYVWLYGGWPLILVLAFIDILSRAPEIFEKSILSRHYYIHKNTLKEKIRSDFKLIAVVAGGLVSGIIINPYFPKNLIFYWNQIVKIAVVNYKSAIGVGGEWSAYKPLELITNSSVALILLIIAGTFFIMNFKRKNALTMNLFLSMVVFFILAMKSRRNLEYFVPLVIAFSSVALTSFLEYYDVKTFLKDVKIFLREQKFFLIALIIPALMIPYIITRDYFSMMNFYENGIEFDKYEAPMEWLRENSAAGTIVFHSDWDEFPMLFYYNSNNYYIVGLDTRFMYAKNPELYTKWDAITTAKEKENIYPIIKNDFKAKYVFIDLKRHEEMDKNFMDNFKFKEVFDDKKTKIYEVL
ncbi:MAG: hypothetical protein US74_C0002G0022 [Parcubacteria group bacterium GW2011_GWA2_38_13]|nr:MAG: hypothetical protein US74_C0002G0022 [Parcubacteria group bacterium GW2011_GWA2_38_13]